METPGAETSTGSIGDDLEAAFSASEDSPAELAVETADATARPETAPSGEAELALEAPKHWKDTDKALFGKAPREIQQRWIDRESETRKGLDEKFQEIAGFRREREQLNEIFAPMRRDLELRGISTPQFMQSLVSVHSYLQENPQEALKWLASQYGVDPGQLTEQSNVDPQFDKLNKGFQDLSSRVNGFVTAQTQAEHQANLGKVTNFAEAKDANGKPSHPYFDEVANDVLLLMKAGEKDLERAYTKACRMNDKVAEKVTADRTASESARALAQRKAEIQKAKTAGKTSAASEVNGATQTLNLRQQLEQDFASWTP